jgi:flavin reductase (DIM6/NTAB) family NADH-FMN oxidoreductase RutF
MRTRESTTSPAYPTEAEAPTPPVTPDAFRSAMRQIPAAVTVVTTAVQGIRHGLTATAVSSVSAEPAQVLICVNRRSRSTAAIFWAGRFGLNYLTAEHANLAEAFATPTVDPEDRFRHARWTHTPSGTPLLIGALVAFDCTVINEIRSGTHIIFIGQVTDAGWREEKTLLYQRGTFGEF